MPKNKSWLDSGIESITKNPAYDGKYILKNMHPQKMSGVLLDFAKPLLDSIDQLNRSAVNASIQMAITVWNYSIIVKQDNASSGLADGFDVKSMKMMMERAFSDDIGKGVLSTLLERKESLYPANNRFITDYDLKWNDAGDEYRLTVLSTD